jgi:Protein of unknown function (DUF1761)
MPGFADLDWIAILISTFVAGGLGAAWYSKALFGEAWMAELGMPRDALGLAGPAIGGSVFSCFVCAVSLAWLLAALGISSAGGGAAVGALVGCGIVAMTMFSDALFSGWSLRLYLIQVGYRAIYIVLIGAIVGGLSG